MDRDGVRVCDPSAKSSLRLLERGRRRQFLPQLTINGREVAGVLPVSLKEDMISALEDCRVEMEEALPHHPASTPIQQTPRRREDAAARSQTHETPKIAQRGLAILHGIVIELEFAQSLALIERKIQSQRLAVVHGQAPSKGILEHLIPQPAHATDDDHGSAPAAGLRSQKQPQPRSWRSASAKGALRIMPLRAGGSGMSGNS